LFAKHELIRHSRWRLAFVAVCLPYVLAAVLVDFVHLDTPRSGRAARGCAAFEAGPSRPAPAEGTDSSCPACAWLRVGHRSETRVSIGAAAHTTVAQIVVLEVEWPDSPVRRQAALRGPPRQILS
jgi:hypothetical protein